ncbi:hypothetical protein B566_EDAN016662 [Ephemera danica]|nr:hypothetical protein B566_EDAN016662 [Ephemera danica]
MSHTTLDSRVERTTNPKLILTGLSLADVDYTRAKRYCRGNIFPPRRYISVFLAAGATCVIIVTYLGLSYNPQIDEYTTLYKTSPTTMETPMIFDNQCVTRCEEAMQLATDVKPNYKLPFNFSASTCSFNATSRGANQRVVIFSFYGNISSDRSYFQGIRRNAQRIQQLYPDWVMRVYHNASDPHARQLLCQTQCSYGEFLDTCFVGDLPGYGNLTDIHPMVWRFLPMSDPLVDVALSRDLDSILSVREQAAVQEWLSTGAALHVMRDHKDHKTELLGGTWGAHLNDSNRCEWRVMIEHILLRAEGAGKGRDQVLLREEIWKYSNRPGWALQHDSYHCEKYKNLGISRAFPTQRLMEPMNFVGSRFKMDTQPIKVKCPLSCRREPSWKFC